MQENITPEVKETIAPEIDLVAQLQKTITERKLPGTQTTKAVKKAFWDASDDDFTRPKAASATNASETKQTQESEKQPVKNENYTDRDAEGSAAAATGLIGIVTRSVLTGILSMKQKTKLEKNFTENDLELIESKLMDAELEKLDEKEKFTKKRFDRLMNRYHEKIEAVQLSSKDEKEMRDSFETYFKFTQTKLDPKWYVIATIADKIGNKVMDAFTD